MSRFEFDFRPILFVALLLLILVPGLFGENIRGRVAAVLTTEGGSVSFRPEELVAVNTASIPQLQSGLELRIGIPQGLWRYQSSFALLVFRNVSPHPTETGCFYTGARTYMRLIPSRDSMYLRIPFSADHEITGDAFTDLLTRAFAPEDFPLIITVLPVMKGVPDSAYGHLLEVEAVPLWKNEGILTVEITNPSGDADEHFTATVDDNPIPLGEAITLEAGLHKVRITSTHAPAVEQTVAVEPGEDISLSVEMDYSPPEMTLLFPRGAAIFLDGRKIESVGTAAILEIEPGEHEIIGELGDVQVSRRFSIRPGGKVKVELIFDIEIVEFGDGHGNPFGSGDG